MLAPPASHVTIGFVAKLSGKFIFLINPPYDQVAPGHAFVRHLTNRSPSMGLLYLAAMARERGYVPTIIESDVCGMDVDAVANRIIEAQPPYVGITVFTVGVTGAVAIARKIKPACPHTTIIVGGPHISSMGHETLERFAEFDIAVLGEGEQTLVELLGALDAGNSLEEIPGVIYRDGGELKSTPPRMTPSVLDDLPLPAWDLLPGFPRRYTPAAYDYPRGPAATIAASRGCPFACRFCDSSTFGTRVRYYSPAKVMQMIKHLRQQWGIRHVLFLDDLFLASRQRTTELCHLLIDSKLKMTWSCAARVDVVTPELLALMKKAGCWQISYGLESGSDELLAKMDKRTRASQGEQAVRWTSEAGIRVKGLFMLGYPGESEQSIQATREFIERLPLTILNLTKFTPYPGSPIHQDIYGTSIREEEWAHLNGMNFVWSAPGITIERLDQCYKEIVSRFFQQRRVGMMFTRMSMRHPEHFRRLLRFGAGLAWAKLRGTVRTTSMVRPDNNKEKVS